jgi:hypothetical protein
MSAASYDFASSGQFCERAPMDLLRWKAVGEALPEGIALMVA